jgi:uncharacterized protein YkwD
MHRLLPLKANPKLEFAAQKFADQIAATGQWSHAGYIRFLNQSGYQYTYGGQNLAREFTDASSTVQAWLNSPTHRANLLSPKFTETGIAIASSSNGDI